MSIGRVKTRRLWGQRALARVLLLVCVGTVALSTDSAQTSQTVEPYADEAGTPVSNFAEAERLRADQNKEAYRKAVEKYKKASEAWRRSKQFEQAAASLRKAGEIAQALGETRDALAYYNESLSLSKNARSRLEEGRIRNDLAYLQFITGQTNESKKNSLTALSLGKSLGDKAIVAQAMSNIGETYYSFGDLAKGVDYQQQALSLWRELGDLRGQSQAFVALGYNYANLGDPQKAAQSYEEALTLSVRINDLQAQTRALIARSYLEAKIGEHQQALDLFNRAKDLAERLGDRTSLAIVFGGTGHLYFALGDKGNALAYEERALELFETGNEKWGVAETKLVLGRIHHYFGNKQEALTHLSQAVDLFKALSMPRLEAWALRDLGLVYSTLNDNKTAAECYRRSLKLIKAGQDQQNESYALNYLGNSFESLDDHKSALLSYRRGLELSRIAADPVGETLSLHNIARLERKQSNFEEAQKQIELAIEIVESLRGKLANQNLRSSYFATAHQTYELYIDILMLRHQERPSEGFDAKAFAMSERARARSFLELLQEARANVREGIRPELLEKERLLKATLNAKAERHIQLLVKKDVAEAARVAKEIDDLTSAYHQLQDEIKATSPRYASLTQPQPLTLKEVQERLLDDGSVMLEYALGDERSYMWAVTRNGMSSYQLPSRKEIEESATRLYKLHTAYQLNAGESVTEWQQRKDRASVALPAETTLLSKLVLGAMAGKLGNKRLLIIADGALQYIPFGALFDPDSAPESPKWLVENHEIVNQPSASTLAVAVSEIRARKKASNAVAVLADPVFEIDDPRVRRSRNLSSPEPDKNLELRKALRDIGISVDGVQIPRLLASREEADGIVSAAPWGTGLKAVGFDANRKRVLGDELASYRIIHFATHGLINNENPELSGIVLSLFDEEGKPQDGFLRLHDIYNLRLPADLVVLSACSTGLGKDVKGEGLIGLTRGFMYAGASGIVASLWKVDDEATAVLMKHFYHGLFVGKLTPAAALRAAQQKTSHDKRWQAPYYWAGFVIQGHYSQNELVPGHFGAKQRWVVIISLVASILLVSTILLVNAIRRRRA
jgi:CHAT domain-containing protein